MNGVIKKLNPCAKEFTPKCLEKNKYKIKRKFNEWLPNSSMNDKCKNENILLNFTLRNGNNYFNLVLQSNQTLHNIIKTLLAQGVNSPLFMTGEGGSVKEADPEPHNIRGR